MPIKNSHSSYMSNPSITLVHQINPPFARNAALAFAEANLLTEVITTVAYDPEAAALSYLNLLPKQLRSSISSELSRRTWVAPNRVPIKTYPLQEVIRIVISRTGLANLSVFKNADLVNWVYTALDRQVAEHHLEGLDAIYSYEDLAATTFKKAKQQGILCLYDLPIPYYQMTGDIMRQEAELFPALAPAIENLRESPEKIDRKQQEIQLADRIFVASSISKQSLLDINVDAEKISTIPYGAPVDYFQPQPKQDDTFRALFLGQISPRKGVHYLLTAWENLKLHNAELVLVGQNRFPTGWLEQYSDVCKYVSSIPHLLLNQYYSRASVFVFPSLIEGFAMVLLEAMACGIPIITTPNTAGPDIITDGIEGFIIPIRDVAAIEEKLEWCYSHPQELAAMGRAARRKAEELTWGLYRQRLASQVKALFPG
jgi:alpha-maltose-1-phosphate synthase